MLTPEQVTELKKQLSSQIQHLAPEQREEAQAQIDEMSPETLELMLKQQQEGQPKQTDKNVLRMIVKGDIPSKRVDENKYALAVLDIRPVSKGHVLIIPLKEVFPKEQLPTQAFTLAKKIAKRMKKKIAPEGIEIQTETKFKEQVINVIPYYEKPLSITSPRYEASQEELEEIQRLIAAKPRKPRKKKEIKKEIASNVPVKESRAIVIKRRIP